MFERFTSDAREAVTYASAEAPAGERVGAEHLLLGTVRTSDTVAARALAQLGVDQASLRAAVRALPSANGLDADALAGVGIDLDAVRAQVEAEFGPGALDDVTPTAAGRRPFDAQARKLLELSLREAIRLKHKRIDSGHLLLAAVRLDDARAATALDSLGLADEDVRSAVGAVWAQAPGSA